MGGGVSNCFVGKWWAEWVVEPIIPPELLAVRAVVPRMGNGAGGRTGGSTMDSW